MRVAVDRVRGEIEAERLLFLLHPLRQGPAGAGRQLDRIARHLGLAEQPALSAGPPLMGARGDGENRFGHRMDARTVGLDPVERTRRGQGLQLALVHESRIDPLGQRIERGEGPARLTLDHQLLHRAFAHRLQRAQRIADGQAILMRLDIELGLAGVDAGGQHRHAQTSRVVDEDGQLVGQRHVVAHRRGVEFMRMMRLQPCGLIGEQRIGGRVALVKAVSGELVDQVEQLVGLLRGDVVHLRAALDEDGALRVHLRLHLFAHRSPQQVRAAQRIARQDLRGLHHLFLIDEDAVRFGQYLFEQGMRVDDLLGPLLAATEAGDIVHRTRPIERHERDDVAEIGRAHRRQRAPHALRFQLEHADRVALLQQAIGRLVVPGERAEIDLDPTFGEQLHRLLQDRQGFQTQEVELHQPRALDELHVELRDGHVRARVAVERHQLRQRPVADHHTGGVGRAVARQALQLGRQVEQAADLIVVGIFLRQLGHAVQRALQVPGIGRVVGHQLGEAVDLAIAHLEHAPGVLEHGTRLQLTEGDDLRDLIATVFLLDVADDLATPGFAKVDVEVGHRHAFRVQEALEQQAELERIEVGDGQRPGDDRARARTTARTDGNVVILGPFDEVGHDQKVAGEAHLDDDVDLEGQALVIGLAPAGFALAFQLGDPVEPGVQTGGRVAAEHRRLALAVTRETGEDGLAPRGHHGTALGHDQSVLDRLGQVGEQLLHHLGGLQPRLGTAFGTVVHFDIGRIGDAQHGVMCIAEAAIGKATGVGRDQGQVAIIGQVDQLLLGRHLDRVVATCEFDVQPVAEDRRKPTGIGFRPVRLAFRKQAGDTALATSGQRDQALAELLQRVETDMRGEFDRAIQMRRRHQGAQIVIAGHVLRIERDPVDHRADRVGHVGTRDAQHGADDRLYACLLGRIGKGHRGIKAVAIGQARGGKGVRLGLRRNRLGIDRAVEHREGGKDAKRHISGMHCPSLPGPA